MDCPPRFCYQTGTLHKETSNHRLDLMSDTMGKSLLSFTILIKPQVNSSARNHFFKSTQEELKCKIKSKKKYIMQNLPVPLPPRHHVTSVFIFDICTASLRRSTAEPFRQDCSAAAVICRAQRYCSLVTAGHSLPKKQAALTASPQQMISRKNTKLKQNYTQKKTFVLFGIRLTNVLVSHFSKHLLLLPLWPPLLRIQPVLADMEEHVTSSNDRLPRLSGQSLSPCKSSLCLGL